MDHAEGAILYEMQRIDLEFAIVNLIANELSRKGKTDSANKVSEAARYLQRAVLLLHEAQKWSGISEYEQIKMDFLGE